MVGGGLWATPRCRRRRRRRTCNRGGCRPPGPPGMSVLGSPGPSPRPPAPGPGFWRASWARIRGVSSMVGSVPPGVPRCLFFLSFFLLFVGPIFVLVLGTFLVPFESQNGAQSDQKFVPQSSLIFAMFLKPSRTPKHVILRSLDPRHRASRPHAVQKFTFSQIFVFF